MSALTAGFVTLFQPIYISHFMFRQVVCALKMLATCTDKSCSKLGKCLPTMW